METYTYTDLLQALSQPGCPICWLEQRAVTHYIKALFYENVNDIKGREVIRNSLGYCSQHTWELLDASLGNALGISIIYHDILTNILRRLPEPEGGSEKGGLAAAFGRLGRQLSERLKAAAQAMTGSTPCPACELRNTTTDLATNAFARALKDVKIAEPYKYSDGFCVPHLRLAFQRIKDPEVLELLLADSRVRLDVLDKQLAEYIRKNDYRFNQEGFGEERDAWKRVISLMGGEKVK